MGERDRLRGYTIRSEASALLSGLKSLIRGEKDKPEDRGPRDDIYDLFWELSPEAIGYAAQLLVMGGQRWAVCGFYFEGPSADFLSKLAEVHVSDTEGNELGVLVDESTYIMAFYLGGKRPDWFVEGQEYQVTGPKVDKNSMRILWDMREKILEHIRSEDIVAAKKFLQIGIALGGVEENPAMVNADMWWTMEKLRRQVGFW